MTEAWVRITNNKVGDFFGDSWIDLKENPQPMWIDPETKDKGSAVVEWPVKRDGLVFLWEKNTANNQIADTETKKLDLCTLTPRAHAIWGRYEVMDTAGGAFLADESRNAVLLKACRSSNQISLEMVILPSINDQTAVIASFGDNFSIEQKKDRLELVIRTSATAGKAERYDLAPWKDPRSGLKPGNPVHVIITYSPGITTIYFNGTRRGISDRTQGDLGVWTPAQLVFGDTRAGGRNWSGTLENVTISNRVIGLTEARERYAAIQPRLEERKPLEPVVVKARLVKTTATPAPASISPYRRCLSVNVYEIEKVESGTLAEKQIMVAHWSILDAQPVPAFSKRVKGQTETLTLVPFASHPELESERMVTDMDDELPLFYDSTH